ncbi:MAG: hypothetical protein GX452_10550 [Ignavibacteriales bacterium]|jgi:hypothetical protein|nr:DUF6064 family protein [Ignavibacteriaceae bacterium]NLH61832.1 hypothetical protein [Ignavibacteriales bacterium]
MELPFSVEQFFDVMRAYNETVFPVQFLFYIPVLFILRSLFRKEKKSGPNVLYILSFFWMWIGVIYHIVFFTSINKAAYGFGILFILQGILFFVYSLRKEKLTFAYSKDISGIAGIVLIVYALIIYPVTGYFFGHRYPYSPTFGLPCPTTIFTWGVLLLSEKRIPYPMIIIPFLWSVVGLSAAVNIRVYEDFGLIISGLIAVGLIIVKNRSLKG